MPLRVLAGGARLAAEARGEARVAQRQRGRVEDLAGVQRGQRNLGGPGEVQVVVCEPVDLLLGVRQEPGAEQGLLANEDGRDSRLEPVPAQLLERPPHERQLQHHQVALQIGEARSRDPRAAPPCRSVRPRAPGGRGPRGPTPPPRAGRCPRAARPEPGDWGAMRARPTARRRPRQARPPAASRAPRLRASPRSRPARPPLPASRPRSRPTPSSSGRAEPRGRGAARGGERPAQGPDRHPRPRRGARARRERRPAPLGSGGDRARLSRPGGHRGGPTCRCPCPSTSSRSARRPARRPPRRCSGA